MTAVPSSIIATYHLTLQVDLQKQASMTARMKTGYAFGGVGTAHLQPGQENTGQSCGLERGKEAKAGARGSRPGPSLLPPCKEVAELPSLRER